jgi:hypothetical protein
MPTPRSTFAIVASTLGDFAESDAQAVELFYRQTFTGYPLAVRSLIADFLIGHSGKPTRQALAALKHLVAGPLENVPAIEAPVWDESFGAAMEYSPEETAPLAMNA